MLRQIEQPTAAMASGEEAVRVLRSPDSPATFGRRKALTVALASLAIAQAGTGNFDASLDSVSAAVDVMRQGDGVDDACAVSVASLLDSLVKPFTVADFIDGAERCARAAVETLRGPVSRNPARREELADALHNHAVTLWSLGSTMWLQTIEEAIALYQALIREHRSEKVKSNLDLSLRFREDKLSARQLLVVPDIRHPTPRNAPCPCGSGKKYKRCCGAPAGQ
jgi:uncharacterized protein YchJ